MGGMGRIDLDYGLSSGELDIALDLLPEFYNTDTVGPRLRFIDFEKEYKKDIAVGNGFRVRSKAFKKKMKDKDGNLISKGVKEQWGIHSPIFGSDWQDDNAFADRYSCDCGHLKGRIFEGVVCNKCGSKVRFIDVDLKKYAWLKINSSPKFKVIHPLLYKLIDSFFGKGVLGSVIRFNKEMSLNGYYLVPENVDLKKNPYYGIGMVEFQEKFDEIMEFFLKKKKQKKPLYDRIMENREKVFTSAVPLYSAVLRQVFFTAEDYSYTKIDKYYNAMYGNFKKISEETELNSRNEAKINENLYRAQNNLNNAFDVIFTSLTEKEGLIRRNILGGRINFSSRCVITPDASLHSYEISLPYVCMVQLFKEDLINLLVKFEGCTYSEAVNQWYLGYCEFSPKIYKVIEYILKHTKGGVQVLLNRNPTINYGSFMLMDVRNVKTDYDDLSAGLPIACLSSFNADFDGDVLNIFRIITNEFKKEFARVLSPKNSFILSNNDGRLNESFSLLKDQMISLREWVEI